MRAVLLLTVVLIAACSRHQPAYTEEDVRKFIVPGTSRESIIKRFGEPISVEKNPIVENGSTNIDEILYFQLPFHDLPRQKDWVFGGFDVRLKEGKAVAWSASHSR